MNNQRKLITCLFVLFLLCLIISCVAVIGTGIYLWIPTRTVTTIITEDTTITPDEPQILSEDNNGTKSTQITPTDETTNPPSSASEIEPEIAHQMDEIQLQVILVRELEPIESVDRELYSPDQLREKVIQDFFEDYSAEDAQNEARTLAAFGLLQPGFDLQNFYIDLYSEQIAGFYDTETEEMVVVKGEGFGGVEKFVYAHEYTHVLQDQNFDLENGLNYNDEACEEDSERCSAILALIEGDATLTQFEWLYKNATPRDQAELLEMMTEETEMPVFESAPEFITLGVTFPYEYGYLFVDHLQNIGGWGAINRAYQDPPISTEQILHPDRYPDDKPVLVNLPMMNDVLGSDWQEIDRGVMGEFYTYLILAKGLDETARLDEDQAKQAAEGWGGDAYVVYYNTETGETIMILHSTWDSTADADEYSNFFREYADNRFGPSTNDSWQDADGVHLFRQSTDYTTWIFAPDLDTANEILQILEP